MKTWELPKWMQITAWAIPVLGILFAVGSWANKQWLAETFVTIETAGETHEKTMQRILRVDEAAKKRDVEMRLRVIVLEVNWLAAQPNLHPALAERLAFLRNEQDILIEEYERMR